MNHLLTFFFLFGLWAASCRDQYAPEFDARDASQIRGVWRGTASPYRFYIWDGEGYLHQSTYVFSTPNVAEHFWSYETNRDTFFLRSMNQPDKRRVWVAFLENDTTATLTDVTDALHLITKIKKF